MPEARNTDDQSIFEDADPPASGGLAALKEHIANDKITFVMYFSRIIQIWAALAYLIPVIIPARLAYIVALLACLVTSVLRLSQRLPPPQLTRVWAARLVLEDAAHYVLYALAFVVPPPLTLVLMPVTLFAVLHSSSYTQQLLDLLGPGSAPPLRYMISLVELKSQAILRTIATAEIAILPYSVLVLLTGRGSLLVPFVYYRFVTLRYASRRNPYSRAIFAEMRQSLESWAGSPRCPAPLASAIRRGVALVSALSPPIMAEQQ